MISKWVPGLNSSLYKVVYTGLSTLTANDFCNLAQELGAQPSFRKPDNFRTIQEEIARLSIKKRKTPVIIIDEANYINNTILNDLKILFNFSLHIEKALFNVTLKALSNLLNNNM